MILVKRKRTRKQIIVLVDTIIHRKLLSNMNPTEMGMKYGAQEG